MKKEFTTKKLIKENQLKKEKAILESFAKTFNKIKRLNENSLSEYDDWNYPAGADTPDAPWNQPDDPYEDDTIEDVTEIAALTGYKNPITPESSFKLSFEGTTSMGGKFRATLGDYIKGSGQSNEAKQAFLDFLNSVGQEENGTYGDDIFIDLDNPQIKEKILSFGGIYYLNPEYPQQERDFDDGDF